MLRTSTFTVRLRLLVFSNRYSPVASVTVDNFSVSERTPDVVLHQLVPSLKGVALSWDASPIGPAFKRYEVYRDTNPQVSLASIMPVMTVARIRIPKFIFSHAIDVLPLGARCLHRSPNVSARPPHPQIQEQ